VWNVNYFECREFKVSVGNSHTKGHVGMKDVIDTTLNVNEVLPTIVDDNHVHLL
jgi:hypothetical protein